MMMMMMMMMIMMMIMMLMMMVEGWMGQWSNSVARSRKTSEDRKGNSKIEMNMRITSNHKHKTKKAKLFVNA